MKKFITLAVLVLLFAGMGRGQSDSVNSQQKKSYSAFTLKEERRRFKAELTSEIIFANLRLPLTDTTEAEYRKAFWGAEVCNAIEHRSDGSIFSVPQLARSISNLPGFLTNDSTPEGIFSLQGIDTSKNVFIGPTTNIQLVLPFETAPNQFFHKSDLDDSVFTLHLKILLITNLGLTSETGA